MLDKLFRAPRQDPDLKRIIAAMRFAEDDRRRSDADQAVMARIEARRAELLLSDEVVEFHGPKRVADICAGASRPVLWCAFLYGLAQAYAPLRAIEMGTCLGVSGAYIAAALAPTGGRLVTLDAQPAFLRLADETFARLELSNAETRLGKFRQTLVPTLEEMAPVPFVFIDGHHDESATLAYFEQILPHAAPDAVLVFDDIVWSEGMTRAWKAVQDHPAVRLSVDLGPMGVAVLGSGPRSRRSWRLQPRTA